MTLARVIPCLLLRGRGLVKTTKFKDPKYLGDPRNVVKIFNEKEVDELALVDITATAENRPPDFDLVREIVSEAFMPVAYGGGLRSIEDARRMLGLGVEKIIVNTHALKSPTFVSEAAQQFGSQSVVVCLDAKRGFFGKYEIYSEAGRRGSGRSPVEWAREMEERGAGELVIQSIDRDGTMEGYDLELVQSVTGAVRIPVIALGGAGKVTHLGQVVNEGGASAAAAGSMFVFQGKHRAVLISFPDPSELREVLHLDA